MDQHHIPKERETDRARELRRDMPVPERRLWALLRGRRLAGLKFRRQVPIADHVADFYCYDAQLVVELDGMTHVGRGEADKQRTEALRREGVRVIRFTNDDVLEDGATVAEAILHAARQRMIDLREADPRMSCVPSPQPSPGGRGGKRSSL